MIELVKANLMTLEDWERVKHFKMTDAWGDPNKISKDLVTELESYREFIGKPMLVTSGCGGAHLDGSQHYEGLAVDLVFPGAKPADLLDAIIAALRFKFTGIGIYPYWKCKGERVGGMHLDVRAAQTKHLWMAAPVTTPEGKVVQQYIALTRENLIKHGVIGVLA
jgi:hypothetical protein